MFKLICVTNRALCRGDFLQRVEQIAGTGIDGIILREKDMAEDEYGALSSRVLRICREKGVECALHTFVGVANKVGADAIHLSLSSFLALSKEDKKRFARIGVSCHSLDDALRAQNNGCDYVTLGHIFATDCKKGLPGRGLTFLSEICRRAQVPVYAIGGISKENLARVRDAGAQGACIMSGWMTCNDAGKYLEELRNAL